MIGFDAGNGEVLWTAGTDAATFQSPVVVEVAGRSRILVAGNTTLFLLEPRTGKVVWSQPHGGAEGLPGETVIPMPLTGEGYFLNDRRSGGTAIDLQSDGATQRWISPEIRNSFCIPAMSGGRLCSYSSRFLVAVDPVNGKRVWRSREPGNGFVGTLAGRLVVITLNGSLHIGDVTANGFKQVAAKQVFGSDGRQKKGLVWSLPAFSGRSIYLRGLSGIARVDVRPGDKEATAIHHPPEVSDGFAKFLKEIEASDAKDSVVEKYLRNKSMPLIEDGRVHFLFRGNHQDVAVASDLFGARQERAMRRVEGTDLFWYGMALPEPTRASYLFFADYQPTIDPLNRRQFVSSTVAGEMEPNFMKPENPLTLIVVR